MLALLLAPLEALLNAFGSGAMPTNGPSAQMRQTSKVLDDVREDSVAATTSLDKSWQSPAASTAVHTMDGMHTDLAHTSDRGNNIATVTDTASEIINVGYKDLGQVLDHFIRSADAAGPALFTPAGLPVLIKAAEEHLAKASQIVKQVRKDLEGETHKLKKLADEQAGYQAKNAARNKELAKLKDSRASASAQTQPGGAKGEITEKALPGGGVQLTLPNGKTVTAPNAKAAKALKAAITQQGVMYQWGGTTPGQGLDCSGLTQYAYKEAGVGIPRLAQEQGIGPRVDPSQAMAGDLVVWSGHVAMVAGDGTLIEASQDGVPVGFSPMRTSNGGQEFLGIFRPSEAGAATAA